MLVAEALLFWAALAAASGDPRKAAVLLGSHDRALRLLEQQRVDSNVTIYERFLSDLAERLDARELRRCLVSGAELTTGELLDWLISDTPDPSSPLVARPSALA
jgi:hypothetical protein